MKEQTYALIHWAAKFKLKSSVRRNIHIQGDKEIVFRECSRIVFTLSQKNES